MEFSGGCYCGQVRYKTSGDPVLKLQCNCRECQYLTGGGPNFVIGMPEAGFEYTSGSPAKFARTDLDAPVTREFCGNCGTPLTSRAPAMQGVALIKAGSMDTPAEFGMPQMVIFTCDSEPFHVNPEGVPTFDKVPG